MEHQPNILPSWYREEHATERSGYGTSAGGDVRLRCVVGGHDWRRMWESIDLGRNDFVESCPEHDGLPVNLAEDFE